jgi:hypothetical protein
MKKILTSVGVALLLTAPLAHAQLGTSTGTTTVTVAPVAEAAMTAITATTTIASSGTNFTNYTGSTSLTYFIRTTQSTGSGSITLKVTTDFSPTGGPSVTTPPSTGDKLAYTCTLSGVGTACSGSVTASTSASTSVATFGANAHTVTFPGGDTATMAWTLTNDPKYATGSYSATVTFTISAS